MSTLANATVIRHLAGLSFLIAVSTIACGEAPASEDEGDQEQVDALSSPLTAHEACLTEAGAKGTASRPYKTRVNGIYWADFSSYNPFTFDRCQARQKLRPLTMRRLGRYPIGKEERGILSSLKAVPRINNEITTALKDPAVSMGWLIDPDASSQAQADAVFVTVTFNGNGMDAFLAGVALNQVSQKIGNDAFKPNYGTLLAQLVAAGSVESANGFGWKKLGASGSFTLTVSRFGQVFFTPTPGLGFKEPLSLSASLLWSPATDASSFQKWLSGAGSSVCVQLVIPTFCGVKSGPGLTGPSNDFGVAVGATFPPGVGVGVSWGITTLIAEFDPKTGAMKRKVSPLPPLR